MPTANQGETHAWLAQLYTGRLRMPQWQSKLGLQRDFLAQLHALYKLQDTMLQIVWTMPGRSFMRLPTCAPGKEVLRWCAGRGLVGTASHLGRSLRRLLHCNWQPHGTDLQQNCSPEA